MSYDKASAVAPDSQLVQILKRLERLVEQQRKIGSELHAQYYTWIGGPVDSRPSDIRTPHSGDGAVPVAEGYLPNIFDRIEELEQQTESLQDYRDAVARI